MSSAGPRKGQRVLLAAVATLIVAVSLWLYREALGTGYLADDLFQLSMMEGLFGDYSPWMLYTFGGSDAAENLVHAGRGSLPWWTVPHFRFSMLRPLSSILLYFEHLLFPRNALAQHVHSLLWFFVLLVVVARLFRSVTATSIALVAVAGFAVDETMVWMISWLANRCALVSAVFCIIALALHHRADGDPLRSRGRLLELGAWGLAFSAGEYAVGGIAYLLAYEMVMTRSRPLRDRVLALVPGLAVTGVYALVYVLGDFGVYGATTYVDPIHDPARFVTTAAHRIPRMVGEVWMGLAAETERFWFRNERNAFLDWAWPDDGADVMTQAWRHARFSLGMSTVFVVGAWLLARRWWSPQERRVVAWFILGSLLSLVPISAIPPATRSLLMSNLGSSVLFGATLVAFGRALRQKIRSPRPLLTWLRVLALAWWCVLMLWIHVLIEHVYVRQQVQILSAAHDSYERFYGNPPFARIDLRDKHVIVIATPGLVTGIHGISMLNLYDRPLPKTWHVLAMGRRPYLLSRRGRRRVELDSVGSAMHLSPQEVLFRARDDRMALGEVVDVGLFKVKVIHEREGVGPDGLLFIFDRPIDDPSLVWLEVGPDGLRPVEIPPRGKPVAIQPPLLPEVVPRG